MLVRSFRELGQDNLTLIAAGVAFYALLAIIPAVFGAVALYGVFADPAQVERQIASLSGVLPAEARAVLTEQLGRAVSASPSTLSTGAVLGILTSFWSANKGTKALIQAINIAYDEKDERGFFRSNALSFGLTVGGIVVVLVFLAGVAVVPALLGRLGLPDFLQALVSVLRWPVLVALFMGSLAVLYRLAPYRSNPQWRWVSWGTLAASLLWVGMSALFSLYVSRFGSYDETYGSLGAVVVLMLWFWLSAFVILLGAEINSEMEHQTARDTTAPPEKPLGQRGAYVADTVGEAT